MKKRTIIYLTIILGLLFSCSKENTQKSKTDLLTESIWYYDYQMIDSNNNLKPDDEIGDSRDITMKFNTDGTLNYTFNGLIQNVTWNFEFDETVIKIIGLEFDSIGSVSDESNSQVYQLDELNLIYQGKTVDNPDQLTFEIYRK